MPCSRPVGFALAWIETKRSAPSLLGERHVLLDGVALRAGIVSAVTRVDDDLRPMGLPRARRDVGGRLGARGVARWRSHREQELATARGPLDAIAARVTELDDDAHDPALAATDADGGDRSADRRDPPEAAPDGGAARQVDVDARDGARSEPHVVDGSTDRLRQDQTDGGAARYRFRPQRGQLGPAGAPGEGQPRERGPPPPPLHGAAG